jgi:hypothetical protein
MHQVSLESTHPEKPIFFLFSPILNLRVRGGKGSRAKGVGKEEGRVVHLTRVVIC